MKVTLFWFFIFLETYICYRKYFDLNFHIGNKVQEKFSYGFKNLVKLGVRKKNTQQVGRFLIFYAKLQVLPWFLLFLSILTYYPSGFFCDS